MFRRSSFIQGYYWKSVSINPFRATGRVREGKNSFFRFEQGRRWRNWYSRAGAAHRARRPAGSGCCERPSAPAGGGRVASMACKRAGSGCCSAPMTGGRRWGRLLRPTEGRLAGGCSAAAGGCQRGTLLRASGTSYSISPSVHGCCSTPRGRRTCCSAQPPRLHKHGYW